MKLCECGCGGAAPIATMTNRKRGHIQGQAMRFIQGHNALAYPPAYKGGRSKTSNGYILCMAKDHPRASKNGYVREHILVAEKAIGRYLPVGAEVHHVNEVKDDNRTTNLVICENTTYHQLLHARMDAYRATGDPDAKKCWVCQQYDLSITRRSGRKWHHSDCYARYERDRKRKKREQLNSENNLEGHNE